jgi:Leucine-rich repeat (LRR) protein
MEHAQRAIQNWIRDNNETIPLNLSNLGLTSLPEIPDGVRKLYIHRNKLTELPANLPNSLLEIVAEMNELVSIPDTLPDSISVLGLGKNRLQSLPEKLPANLRRLYASENELKYLPKMLPPKLEIMYISDNRITRLPEFMPDTVRIITCRNNPLKSLPYVLPKSLCEFYYNADIGDFKYIGYEVHADTILRMREFVAKRFHMPRNAKSSGDVCGMNHEEGVPLLA